MARRRRQGAEELDSGACGWRGSRGAADGRQAGVGNRLSDWLSRIPIARVCAWRFEGGAATAPILWTEAKFFEDSSCRMLSPSACGKGSGRAPGYFSNDPLRSCGAFAYERKRVDDGFRSCGPRNLCPVRRRAACELLPLLCGVRSSVSPCGE